MVFEFECFEFEGHLLVSSHRTYTDKIQYNTRTKTTMWTDVQSGVIWVSRIKKDYDKKSKDIEKKNNRETNTYYKDILDFTDLA